MFRKEGAAGMDGDKQDRIDWTADNFADILKEDDRYDPRAYSLVLAVVEGIHEHVTGMELLERFRDFTLDEFGPMSYAVLSDWGVKSCSDVGEIVFNLVESGRLGKTERDSRADFIGGYDFQETFLGPYEA